MAQPSRYCPAQSYLNGTSWSICQIDHGLLALVTRSVLTDSSATTGAGTLLFCRSHLSTTLLRTQPLAAAACCSSAFAAATAWLPSAFAQRLQSWLDPCRYLELLHNRPNQHRGAPNNKFFLGQWLSATLPSFTCLACLALLAGLAIWVV